MTARVDRPWLVEATEVVARDRFESGYWDDFAAADPKVAENILANIRRDLSGHDDEAYTLRDAGIGLRALLDTLPGGEQP